jgi:hypothetical protein
VLEASSGTNQSPPYARRAPLPSILHAIGQGRVHPRSRQLDGLCHIGRIKPLGEGKLNDPRIVFSQGVQNCVTVKLCNICLAEFRL